MVPLVTRRIVIGGCVSTLLSALPSSDIATVEDLAEYICRYTPLPFRQAIRDSRGCFLYRGDDGDSTEPQKRVARICHPPPDLLLPNTYQDKDALAYFQCLEHQLGAIQARPSLGHMGTSVVDDAALWGAVVSVWPLGSELSYVWPRDSRTFFPLSQCPEAALEINVGLEMALRKGSEVLFASWYDPGTKFPDTAHNSSWISSFVAVPRQYDSMLLHFLEARRYGV